MGYVEIFLYFFCASETVVDLANQSRASTDTAVPHPLSELAKISPSPNDNAHTGIILTKMDESINFRFTPEIPIPLLRCINVYGNDFVALAQGGAEYRRRVHNHAFHTIDKGFWNNAPGNNTRQEPNYLKKLWKGDAAWT